MNTDSRSKSSGRPWAAGTLLRCWYAVVAGIAAAEVWPIGANAGQTPHSYGWAEAVLEENTSSNGSISGTTALMSAAVSGNAAEVRRLLSNKTVVDQRDSRSATALWLACRANQPATAALLLQADADPNICDDYGNYPIHEAAAIGSATLLDSLLTHGAQVDAQTMGGETALMLAASVGSIPCVKLLVQHKANVKIPNWGGQTAILAAALNGHPDIVQLLKQAGAVPGSGDVQELLYAAQAEQPEVVSQILSTGVDPNIEIRGGYTALMLADGVQGSTDAVAAPTVEALIKGGADPNQADDHAVTPLMYAALTGKPRTVACLLRYGAKPDLADKISGQTALHYATDSQTLLPREDVAGTVQALLDGGASVDAQDSAGMTAMMHASEGGYVEVVRVLLARGANPTLKDLRGRTALAIAREPSAKPLQALEIVAPASSKMPVAATANGPNTGRPADQTLAQRRAEVANLLEHANAR